MDPYQFNLNTYTIPPSEFCSLNELERLCEERLKLYKIMDEADKLEYTSNSREWDTYVEFQIMRNKLTTYITLLRNDDFNVGQIRARRNDHIAHWLLSLCYCQTKDLRKFFMKNELHWFVMLFKRTKEGDLEEFLTQNRFDYTPISQKEKQFLKKRLLLCSNIKETNFGDTIFYKIKFSEVSNLVAIRRIFLHKGVAYFPECDLIYCIKDKLWRQFNKQLVWINKMLPTNIKEERMEHFLRNVPLVTPSQKTFKNENISITIENIDDVAKTHFPLCMKTIHSELRTAHHLKYDCKMQYGIFLKWAGLSYQHAMEFWKDEFTRNMSSDFFDRKYAYLFKHQYGKVGGMIQYNPFSCEKIQNSCPGPGQHHGCPYKHWDLERLLERCQHDGFSFADANRLRRLVAENKYKEACTMYFNITHKVAVEEVFKSPNQYFETSYEFEEALDNCLVDIFDDYCSESD